MSIGQDIDITLFAKEEWMIWTYLNSWDVNKVVGSWGNMWYYKHLN